jgi:hypothetical protein
MNRRFERVLILVGLVGIITGGLMEGYAWQLATLFSLGNATPGQVRLADLERDGPGNNIHVRVTDFVLPPNYVVDETNGKWNQVCVPMLPADQPGRRGIKVVARSFYIADEGQLQEFYRQTELTGVVVNAVWRLGTKEAETLTMSYPGSDFSSVLLIDTHWGFPTKGGVATWIGVASGLLALGVFATVLSVVLMIRRQSA